MANFEAYWWQWHAVGEAEAHALALVVLLSGYQTLILAERLALPELSLKSIPSSRLFWALWWATALSLPVILWVPPVARLLRVVPPVELWWRSPSFWVLAVGWRFLLSHGRRPV